MIDHCCDANRFFDEKEAKSKAKSFRKKGARKATAELIKMMQPQVNPGDSLLDIGGGIGAIGLELKALGRYTSVDASSAYLIQAQQLFEERNWSKDQLRFIEGDFVEEASKISKHHHLSLDKVICCYPDMEELLKSAAQRCEKQLGLVYPITGFIPNLFQGLANLYFRFKKTAFRTYLHSPQKVHALLTDQGFTRSAKSTGIPWRIEVWQRTK